MASQFKVQDRVCLIADPAVKGTITSLTDGAYVCWDHLTKPLQIATDRIQREPSFALNFQPGDHVEYDDQGNAMPAGMKGIVKHYDPNGLVCVQWSDGSVRTYHRFFLKKLPAETTCDPTVPTTTSVAENSLESAIQNTLGYATSAYEAVQTLEANVHQEMELLKSGQQEILDWLIRLANRSDKLIQQTSPIPVESTSLTRDQAMDKMTSLLNELKASGHIHIVEYERKIGIDVTDSIQIRYMKK